MSSPSPRRRGAGDNAAQQQQSDPARSSSPLAFPASSSPRQSGAAAGNAPASTPLASASGSNMNNNINNNSLRVNDNTHAPRSSSPLAFPSSSSPRRPAANGGGANSQTATPQPANRINGNGAAGNPLFAPDSATRNSSNRIALQGSASRSARSSSAALLLAGGRRNAGRSTSNGLRAGSAATGENSDDGRAPSSEPLFFPSSATPKTRPARGDIHSSLPISPSPLRRRAHQAAAAGGGGGGDGAPSSSAPDGNGSIRSGPAGRPNAAPSLSNVGVSSDAVEENDRNQGARTVIWNTSVSLDETMSSFKMFLQDFKAKYRTEFARRTGKPLPYVPDPERPVYEHYLRKMRITKQTNLNLDLQDLEAYPPTKKLARWMRTYPQECVPMCDQVLKDCMIDLAWKDHDTNPGTVQERDIEDIDLENYKIRPFGTYEVPDRGAPRAMPHDERTLGINMRELNPKDIDKLVTVKGLVIRCTPIIPDMKLAFFRCLACSHSVTVDVDRGQIAEPDRCPREVCNLIGSMSLVHNRCDFADRQVIRLQETPDVVPDGQTPHTVSLCVYDELVDLAKPGDRVVVTGIFRSVPVRVNPKQRVIKSLFKTYVDALHIRKTDKKRLGLDRTTRGDEASKDRSIGVGPDEEEDEIANGPANGAANEELRMDLDESYGEDTLVPPQAAVERRKRHQAEQEEKLVELSRRADIYDLLARSLAPSIWEMDDVKKGILLQMFGGTNKSISKGGGAGGPRYRGDINVLLVGDPGTSKSQILQYVHKIAPRGVYTSGKGSSAVGLTAYVTRDPDSKQLVLESGALVLSDGGVCCIDEFDKMSDATRSVLHEVMEQQTVSIAKAGIITTLNARTSILAAANPVGSKYNLNWPITRNIDLPPTLISRFDLLYLVLDKIDESNDRRLAKHLVGLYLEDRPDTGGSDILPIETLTAYLSYARNHIHPVITEPASQALVQAYVTMRSAGIDARGGSERRITATTRQLESMIRLSEAHARMRFSDRVELADVQEAHRLIREALKESATDPITGLIDLDLLNTGHGMQQRKMHGDLRREILTILDRVGTDKGVRWTEVAKILNEQSSIPVDANELGSVIRELEQEGQVAVRGTHDKRTLRKLAA